MEKRVAAGEVEIGCTVQTSAHILAILQNGLAITPGHLMELSAAVFGEDVAVLAALVALICYMPLEAEVFAHTYLLITKCSSISPH
jgi:hypothetical protein